MKNPQGLGILKTRTYPCPFIGTCLLIFTYIYLPVPIHLFPSIFSRIHTSYPCTHTIFMRMCMHTLSPYFEAIRPKKARNGTGTRRGLFQILSDLAAVFATHFARTSGMFCGILNQTHNSNSRSVFGQLFWFQENAFSGRAASGGVSAPESPRVTRIRPEPYGFAPKSFSTKISG